MKQKIVGFLYAAFFVLASVPLVGQTFKKFYGTSQYEEFWGSTQLSDGTMVHAGYSNVSAYIIRTNAMGDTMWTRVIPEPGWGLLYSVQECSDQAIIVAGRSSGYGAGLTDVYLMKLNLAGQILWRKAIGTAVNETANEVKVCQDKGFLIAGYTKVPNGNNYSNDAYVIKTDSIGNLQWTKAFNGIANSNAYDVEEMINGDIIVTGLTIEPTVDVFIARLGPTGNVKWKKKYGSSGDDRGMELIINAQCDIFVTGLYNTAQMLLMKVDSTGNLQWAKSYGGSGQWAYTICDAGGGNMVICGHGVDTNNGSDYLLIKTNQNGDTLWARLHGTPQVDYAQKVSRASNGGDLISGYSRRNASSDYDLLVVRTDSLGNTVCESRRAAITVNTLSLVQSVSSLSVASLGTQVAVNSNATSTGTVEVICANCISFSPVAFVNSPVCAGQLLTFSASVNPSVTAYYQWTGPAGLVSSLQQFSVISTQQYSGQYTLTAGTSTSCVETTTVIVSVLPQPTIGVNSGSICAGQQFTVIPSGATVYTVQGISTIVSPVTPTSYTVIGQSSNLCLSANIATCFVNVLSAPALQINGNSTVCQGEAVTLYATGASNYTWSTGANSSTLSFSPVISTVISLSGASATNACVASSTLQVNVALCTSMNDHIDQELKCNIYPNPTTGPLKIQCSLYGSISIYNIFGQRVTSIDYSQGLTELSLEEQPAGTYLVFIVTADNCRSFKIHKM